VKRCTFILIVCLPLLVCAQTFTDVTPANITAVDDGDIAWGDFDNDGYLDFAIAGQSATAFAAIYKGAGNGTFQLLANHGVPGAINCDLEWGDIDNDGDLDLAVIGKNSLVILRNNITAFAQVLSTVGTDFYRGSLTWFDYDNDGDLDLYGRSIVFVNVDGQFPDTERFRLQGFDRETLIEHTVCIATDFDNDGDQDVFTSGKYNHGTWNECSLFFNNGVRAIELTSEYRFSYNDIDVRGGSINQGDFNKDGFWDYVITGDHTSISSQSDPFSKLLIGNGTGNFSRSQSLVDVYNSSSDVGDIDNDGDLDIIIAGNTGSGHVTRIFHNDGQGHFSDANTQGLAALQYVAIRLGDYDNDGDLDFLMTGRNSSNAKVIKLYRNDLKSAAVLPNEKPTPPTNLHLRAENNSIIMEWNAGTDKETPANSLSYNFYVGIQPRKPFKFYTESNPETGKRMVARHGNASMSSKWVLGGLKTGTYRFSAQSIDGAYAGSEFAEEVTFDLLIVDAEGASCTSGEQMLSISRSGSYTWTVTGGMLVEGQGTNKIKVKWGNNPVGAKVTVTNGTSSNSFAPVLQATPEATITGPKLVCSLSNYVEYNVGTYSEILNYDWNMDGKEYKSTYKPSFYWPSPGTKPVSVEVTHKTTGCQGKGSIEVFVSEPIKSNVVRDGDVFRVESPKSSYSYKWEKYINDAWVTVGDKDTYVPTTTGSYMLTVTNELSCSSTHNFQVPNIITGALYPAEELILFPNPTTRGFYVPAISQRSSVLIAMSDVMGRYIDLEPTQSADGLYLDCTSVKPGVYLVTILIGDTRVQRKLVIE